MFCIIIGIGYSFQLVGKSVGQLFRKEIVIEELPPIARNQNRHSIANLLGRQSEDDGAIANIFSLPNNGS